MRTISRSRDRKYTQLIVEVVCRLDNASALERSYQKRSLHFITKVNKSVSVFKQTATLPLAAYESHAGFSLLQCATALAVLATPSFPRITFPRPLLLPRDINHA